MRTSTARRSTARTRQSGATVIEFALVMVIFLSFLLAVTDFSRMLFTWNAANEATRAGARYAVVCDDKNQQDLVLARMQGVLPQISISNINIVWSPDGCTTATCEGVTVSIVGLNYQWISPIGGLVAIAPIAMPTFSTYLNREVMRQDANSAAICV